MDKAKRSGTLLILVAAAGYATSAIFTKTAYAAGMEPLNLILWSYLLAAPLIWLAVTMRRPPQPPTSPRLRLLGLGILYALPAATAFVALAHLPASIFTVLLYTYPAFVAVFSTFLGDPLPVRGWLALGLALAGVALTVPLFDAQLGDISLMGIGLALLTAALYAVHTIATSRLLRGYPTSLRTGAWSITGSLLLLSLLLPLRGLSWPTHAAWDDLLALAVVGTALPIFTFYAGIQRLGAAQAAILVTFEPLFTVLLAMWLLGETMQPVQWLGGALILVSVVLFQKGNGFPRRWRLPRLVIGTPNN